jgi:hypothetical protein
MWIELELYPTCNPWLPAPANVVAMLGRAIVLYVTAAGFARCCRLCEAAQLPLRIRLGCHGWAGASAELLTRSGLNPQPSRAPTREPQPLAPRLLLAQLKSEARYKYIFPEISSSNLTFVSCLRSHHCLYSSDLIWQRQLVLLLVSSPLLASLTTQLSASSTSSLAAYLEKTSRQVSLSLTA